MSLIHNSVSRTKVLLKQILDIKIHFPSGTVLQF